MKLAWLVVAACVVAADAQAQFAPYENDGERLGASLVLPVGRRDFVRKTMDYCATWYEDMRLDARVAYAHWVRRNAAFLRMSASMKRFLAEQAEKDPSGKGAEWKQLLGEAIPRQIEAVSATATRAIAELPSGEARRQMCADSIASVDGLKLDLDASDPEIAAYLRAAARKNGVDVPAAGVDTARGAPGARRDAAALRGRWQTETVVYYLGDGTQRQASGGCVLVFGAREATSECREDGPYGVRYAFHADDSGRYDSQILEHSGDPGAAGRRASGLFRVEGRTLHISVFPTGAPDDGKPVEIESVAVLQEAEKK